MAPNRVLAGGELLQEEARGLAGRCAELIAEGGGDRGSQGWQIRIRRSPSWARWLFTNARMDFRAMQNIGDSPTSGAVDPRNVTYGSITLETSWMSANGALGRVRPPCIH